MKTAILVLLNLFLAVPIYSQESNPVFYHWEGYTSTGNTVYGISEFRGEAIEVIKDYNQRNQNSKSILEYYIIRKAKGLTVKDLSLFKEKYKKGYRVLSRNEMISLKIMYLENFPAAVQYYHEVKSISLKEANSHLEMLKKERILYRILAPSIAGI